MFRSMLCSMVVLGLFVGFAAAEDTKKTDSKDKSGKKGKEHHAKITKVDAKKGTVTVSMKGKDGKETEKTFKLAEDIEYADSNGNVARADIFTSGDLVLIVERDGKVSKIKKHDKKDKSGSTKKPSDK